MTASVPRTPTVSRPAFAMASAVASRMWTNGTESAVEGALENATVDDLSVSVDDVGELEVDPGRLREPPGDADLRAYFEYGGSVPHAETGTTLPNLRTLARVHGWSTAIDTDYEDGIRIVVSGVKTYPVEWTPTSGRQSPRRAS